MSPLEITGWVTLVLALAALARVIWSVVRWGTRLERAVVKTEQQTNGALDSRFVSLERAVERLAASLDAQGTQIARTTGELSGIKDLLTRSHS